MHDKDLFAAIETNDLEAVQAWVAEHGTEKGLVYPIPGDQFDTTIVGTALNIAIFQKKSRIAVWLLENGAAHHVFGYNKEAGHVSNSTFHPLGTAIVNGMDEVASLMLSQGVDFTAQQYYWCEEMNYSGEFDVFGKSFLSDKRTRPLLERIGRLDVLDQVAKLDLRTSEEKEYDAQMATRSPEEKEFDKRFPEEFCELEPISMSA